jgi:hypothetical protein
MFDTLVFMDNLRGTAIRFAGEVNVALGAAAAAVARSVMDTIPVKVATAKIAAREPAAAGLNVTLISQLAEPRESHHNVYLAELVFNHLWIEES